MLSSRVVCNNIMYSFEISLLPNFLFIQTNLEFYQMEQVLYPFITETYFQGEWKIHLCSLYP